MYYLWPPRPTYPKPLLVAIALAWAGSALAGVAVGGPPPPPSPLQQVAFLLWNLFVLLMREIPEPQLLPLASALSDLLARWL